MDKHFLMYVLKKFAFEFVTNSDLRLRKIPRIILSTDQIVSRFLSVEFNGATFNGMQLDSWFDRYLRPEFCRVVELIGEQTRGCSLIGFYKLPVPSNLNGGTIELEGFSARILNIIAQNYEKTTQIVIKYTPLWALTQDEKEIIYHGK